eukprot:gene2999-5009_t
MKIFLTSKSQKTFTPKNFLQFVNIDFPDKCERFGFTSNYVEKEENGVIKGYFYVYAPSTKTFLRGDNKMFVYSIEDGKWITIKEKGNGPYSSRTFHSAVVYKGNTIVLYGGVTEQPWSNIFTFDIYKHSWSRGSGFEIDRYCHSACILNDKMVIFGGVTRVTKEQQLILNTIDEYDIEKQDWTKNENASKKGPQPRFMHTSISVNGKMYIFGGINQKLNILQDLWSCDENYHWSQVSTSNIPQNFGSIPFLMDNLLCFYGGTDGRVLSKSVSVINLSTNTSYVVETDVLFLLDHPEEEFENILFPQGIVHNGQFYYFGGRKSVPDVKIEKNSKQIPAQDFIEAYFNLDTFAKNDLIASSSTKTGSFASIIAVSNQVKNTSSNEKFKATFKSEFTIDDTEIKF